MSSVEYPTWYGWYGSDNGMIGGVVHRNGLLDGVKDGAVGGATWGNCDVNGKGDDNMGGAETGGCLDDPSPGRGGGMSWRNVMGRSVR